MFDLVELSYMIHGLNRGNINSYNAVLVLNFMANWRIHNLHSKAKIGKSQSKLDNINI